VTLFGRTPREYLRLAAIPIAVFAVFELLRVDLYRHAGLQSDGFWVMVPYQATLLVLLVRVRMTGFGDFKALLPLFAMATATLWIVDSANFLVGRRSSDNLLVANGAILSALLLGLTLLLHWALGSIVLFVSMTRARMVLLGVFVFLFVAAIVPQIGLGVPLLVMAVAGLAFLVGVVVPKRTNAAKWLGYAGAVFMLATTATCVGGTVACERQYGDEQTAEQLVAAIESYRQTHGHYPESLDALPSPPRLEFGQRAVPYYYGRHEDSFTLSYTSGFRARRVYDSARKEWESWD
jgi:hypothetical protein